MEATEYFLDTNLVNNDPYTLIGKRQLHNGSQIDGAMLNSKILNPRTTKHHANYKKCILHCKYIMLHGQLTRKRCFMFVALVGNGLIELTSTSHTVQIDGRNQLRPGLNKRKKHKHKTYTQEKKHFTCCAYAKADVCALLICHL